MADRNLRCTVVTQAFAVGWRGGVMTRFARVLRVLLCLVSSSFGHRERAHGFEVASCSFYFFGGSFCACFLACPA